MKFPIFASFIIFIVWLSIQLSRTNKRDSLEEKSFWEKEQQANATMRKSLDNLAYIRVPLDMLPLETLEAYPQLLETLTRLSTEKIVNFTGLTNTDLKLQYGAPNISFLTEYDKNFILLITTLEKWAELLLEEESEAAQEARELLPGYVKPVPSAANTNAAKTVLQYAVSIGSDICKSYQLLADIYIKEDQPEKLVDLRNIAQALPELQQKRILRSLEQKVSAVHSASGLNTYSNSN